MGVFTKDLIMFSLGGGYIASFALNDVQGTCVVHRDIRITFCVNAYTLDNV